MNRRPDPKRPSPDPAPHPEKSGPRDLPRQWRSLADRDLDDATRLERIAGELEGALPEPVELDRRGFLRLMGASLALAGVAGTGCTQQPPERIVPYVSQPEHLIPGKPLFYATAIPLAGYAMGVLVESHTYRPTRIDGNPEHPASLGGCDSMTQAAVLGLYEPARSQAVLNAGRIASWAGLLNVLAAEMEAIGARQGAGLRLLTGAVTSPTLAHQMAALLDKLPRARWHRWEPAGRGAVHAGARLAFGRPLATRYRFDRARCVLALDADFMTDMPGAVRYAHDFAARRREPGPEMGRLWVAEPTPTPTGSLADERLALGPAGVAALARAVARRLGAPPLEAPEPEARAAGVPDAWLDALVADLSDASGESIVVPGDHAPAQVHALAHAINHHLGNVGRTVEHTEPVEVEPGDSTESLRALVRDMDRGEVELLVILDGNPVHDAPAAVGFAEAMRKVGTRIHVGLYRNETAELCHWHVPAAHPLESWSDARAFDGTATILQPLIAPLYGGKTSHEIVATLLGRPTETPEQIVKAYWRGEHERAGAPRGTNGAAGDDEDDRPSFEAWWRRALHDGVVPASAFGSIAARLRDGFSVASPPPPSDGIELVIRPDPTVHDGRFATNGWLQELPKPLTKLTWDNAALLAPATAERLGVETEQVVTLRVGERDVAAPVLVHPGQAPDVVTVHLGYGRRQPAGASGIGHGFDASRLRPADGSLAVADVAIEKTGGRWPLAITQEHSRMHDRHIVRHATVARWLESPDFVKDGTPHEPKPEETLYPPVPFESPSWGMVIDLSICNGCSACVTACVAENNIPVVGKTEVARGREMHWIRVDRYFEGAPEDPRVLNQPVPCMHCENAPCEVVCPVGATVHSDDGLNDMIYNRCVGTRYCSNNCPYKVRRFNFLQYADEQTQSLRPLRNPDVTVRTLGVMEKCTYCVQRIRAVGIEAKKEGRPVGGDEVVTACQAACPTRAIAFGDICQPGSLVARLRAEPRNYGLLAHLGTRPRTTYLARIEHPADALERERSQKKETEKAHGGHGEPGPSGPSRGGDGERR